MIEHLKKIKTLSIWYKLVSIQFLLLLFMPPMDGKTSSVRLLIYIVFALLSVVTALAFVKEKILTKTIQMNGPLIFVGIFFIMCIISGVWSLVNHNPLSDVIRGVLPFVWFLYIIIIIQTMSMDDIKGLFDVIGGLSVVYAIRIFIFYFIYVAGHSGDRVTFHLIQSTSMMPMVGTILFGYYFVVKEKKKNVYIILSLICYISVVLTETKSMLLAVLAGWILLTVLLLAISKNFIIEKKSIRRRVISVCILMTLCTMITIGMTNLGNRWKNMVSIKGNNTEVSTEYSKPTAENSKPTATTSSKNEIVVVDTGSVSVRLIEMQTAKACLIKSPIMGKGLGYRWTAKGINYGGPVIYMHNIFAFTMMDFGIVGILFIISLLSILFIMLLKVYRKRDGKLEDKVAFMMTFSIITMAFIYANFFAVIRSIEYVLVCSVFFAALYMEYKRIINGEYM